MQGRRERAGFVTEASLTNWSSKRPSSPMVPQNMQVTTEVSSMKQAVRQYWRSGSSTRPSSSMVRQWFFNGSSISGDDNKSSSTTQKVRQNWRTGSSIVRQCARRVRQYWRTFWPLTNFLGHWRSFAVVSSYWRTIDELGCVYEPDRQYWRTACFIDELLWSAAYFEEPWVNCQTWALTSSSTIEK